MDKVLQFRRGSMGLAFALPNYRLFCCNPMHARMHGQGYCRQQNLSGESVWSGCEKGGLRAGDPACHCSYGPVGPVSPSCLMVPGLTLETQFGLPVCPAGDHRHTSCLTTPPPLALAHKPLLPGGSWLSACQRSGYSGAAGTKSLGQAGKAQGMEDVSASGSTWGREQSVAGSLWARSCPWCAGCASSLPALHSSHNGPIVSSSQAVWRRFLGHPYPPK